MTQPELIPYPNLSPSRICKQCGSKFTIVFPIGKPPLIEFADGFPGCGACMEVTAEVATS